ncbi:MAG: sulfite exporter TauE/SafE family protein [Planctomycetota bacterium]
MKTALLATLAVLAVGYAVVLVVGIRRFVPAKDGSDARWVPTWLDTLIGFVTNFFDTLGIGSFAPTTAWYHHAKLVPDELIPGTMNAGHTMPVLLMAYLYIDSVEVESTTLVSLVVSAMLGAWFGAGVVSRLPKKRIQIGMGIALVVAAFLMAASQLGLKPGGAEALGLDWPVLVPACLVMAVLGALNTIGVGLYAPCMILISLLGMNPRAAFPIMMGACAFLMPVASTRFVLEKKQRMSAALGLALGGLPAVLVAALIVKSVPLYALKWLVIAVVLVTAGQMLRSARRPRSSSRG